MTAPPRVRPYPLALYFPDRDDIGRTYEYVSMLERMHGVRYNCFLAPGWLVCTVVDTGDDGVSGRATTARKRKSLKELLDIL